MILHKRAKETERVLLSICGASHPIRVLIPKRPSQFPAVTSPLPAPCVLVVHASVLPPAPQARAAMTIARGRRRAVHELLERELQPPSTEAAQAVARAEAQAAVAVENARAAVRLAELAEQEDTHERLVKQIERKMNPVRAPCAPPPLAKVTISAPSTCHPRKDTQPPSLRLGRPRAT